jgi:hypothetical protein
MQTDTYTYIHEKIDWSNYRDKIPSAEAVDAIGQNHSGKTRAESQDRWSYNS